MILPVSFVAAVTAKTSLTCDYRSGDGRAQTKRGGYQKMAKGVQGMQDSEPLLIFIHPC
jgi:hypothetical protein